MRVLGRRWGVVVAQDGPRDHCSPGLLGSRSQGWDEPALEPAPLPSLAAGDSDGLRAAPVLRNKRSWDGKTRGW